MRESACAFEDGVELGLEIEEAERGAGFRVAGVAVEVMSPVSIDESTELRNWKGYMLVNCSLDDT